MRTGKGPKSKTTDGALPRPTGRSAFASATRRTTYTNGLHIRRIDAFLERRRRMKCDGQVLALVTASMSRTIWTCVSVTAAVYLE